MTREEFELIVKKFNEEKLKYNWISVINSFEHFTTTIFKREIKPFPTYYNFVSPMEFKFWILHSEEEDFVSKRFCPICGAFITKITKNWWFYSRGCCPEHAKQVSLINSQNTLLKKYGGKSPMASKATREKMMTSWKNKSKEEKTDIRRRTKQTKLERYGNEEYNNRKKAEQTCLERYGAKTVGTAGTITRKKLEENNLQKFGCVSPFGNKEIKEKVKETNLERYGVEYIGAAEEVKEKIQNTITTKYGGMGSSSKEIKEKIEKTNLKRYGTINPAKNEKVKEKINKTNLEKYGVEYPLQNTDIHRKTIEAGNAKGSYKLAVPKVKATKLELYGDENYNNKESAIAAKLNWTSERKDLFISRQKETSLERYGAENYSQTEESKERFRQICLEKYGVDNPAKVPEIMEKAARNANLSKIRNHTTPAELMQNEEFKLNYVQKCNETKRKNGTFNTSVSLEDKFISYLIETYPQYTILTQYHDDPRYPFNCDCYVKELDLFIEFQGSYFHNWRPFNNSEAHIKEYNDMVEKGGQLKTIADIWRYKDVEKRKIAKENNLNYLEYWEYLKLLSEDVNNNQNNLVLYYQQESFYRDAKVELYDPIKRWHYYQNAIKYSDFYKTHGYVSHLALLRRPYISRQIGFSSFNIKLCEMIDKKYRVYDPCGGWGHRLLGFKDHAQYIYNDINCKVENNCIKMANDLNITNIKFYNQDAAESIQDEYDVVFTCPPYFGKEIYSDKGAENYSEEEFIKWWNTVLDNLHPTTGDIYIVINSNYLKYFTSNSYKYEIVVNKLRESHLHKDVKKAEEIVIKYHKIP